ncbi:hypothetical protein SHO565_55650 [Streptomyces sp. HO565]
MALPAAYGNHGEASVALLPTVYGRQLSSIGVSANSPPPAHPCAARVGALRTFEQPLNSGTRRPSERTRDRNRDRVVEHADATATPPGGNTLTLVEPGSDETANPTKAAATATTSISDAERELYGGRLRYDQPYIRHEGP